MERRVLVFKEHLVHSEQGVPPQRGEQSHWGSRGARWTCCHPNSVLRGGQGPCVLPSPVAALGWQLVEFSSGGCQSFPL